MTLDFNVITFFLRTSHYVFSYGSYFGFGRTYCKTYSSSSQNKSSEKPRISTSVLNLPGLDLCMAQAVSGWTRLSPRYWVTVSFGVDLSLRNCRHWPKSRWTKASIGDQATRHPASDLMSCCQS